MRDAITTVCEVVGALLVAVALPVAGFLADPIVGWVTVAALGGWLMLVGFLFAPSDTDGEAES